MHIAPKNALTIPRMELLAILIGTRTATFLHEVLDISINRMVLWTDATTILQWLATSEILQPFVQNRISEIRKSENIEIRYLESGDNPADLASRGKPPAALQNLEIWWKGPPWLTVEKLWPSPPVNVLNFRTGNTENAIAFYIRTKVLTCLLTDTIENNLSTWDRRIRVFMRILRWRHRYVRPPLTYVQRYHAAEVAFIKQLQIKYFPTEVRTLERGGRVKNDLQLQTTISSLTICKLILAV